jgi:formylglycine-generating enzyme required for sulfatase activity
MGKYEVTQAQWQAVMGSNPSMFKDDPANPVEQVSWDNTQPFLTKLNDVRLVNQWRFGLPTEAQWEYACRAGTTTLWSFGNDGELSKDYAWTDVTSQGKTYPVGQLKPNPFGLFDMHGNVFEWCNDWTSVDYYAQSPENDPIGPPEGFGRVVRGGSYVSHPDHCRTNHRDGRVPSHQDFRIGFRIALSFVGVPDKSVKEKK